MHGKTPYLLDSFVDHLLAGVEMWRKSYTGPSQCADCLFRQQPSIENLAVLPMKAESHDTRPFFLGRGAVQVYPGNTGQTVMQLIHSQLQLSANLVHADFLQQ